MSTQVIIQIDADARSAHQAIARVRSALDSLGGVRLSGVGDALRELGGAAQGALSSALPLQGALMGVASAGVAAAIGAISDAVRRMGDEFAAVKDAAASMTTGLATIQVLGDVADEDMARLRATVQALAEDISLPGVNAQRAADAIGELIRAGLSVDDALKAARSTLLLANAEMMDAGEAATIAAAALNAFGLRGEDSTRVLNALANAAATGAGDIRDYGFALRAAAAVAHSAGLSVEQTVSALVTMANAGIAGSDAGTSLKVALMRLTAPTKDVRAALEELGVSVFDAQGNTRDFTEVLRDLAGALEPLSEQRRAKLLTDIFGADAIRAASILTTRLSEYEAVLARLSRESTLQRLADAQMRGIRGTEEGWRNAIDALRLRIGTALFGDDAREGGFSQIARRQLESFAAFVERYGPSISAFFERLGYAALRAYDVVTSVLGVAQDYVLRFVGALQGIFDAMGLGKAMQELSDTFSGISDRLDAPLGWLRQSMQGIADLVLPLSELMGHVFVGAITGLAEALSPVSKELFKLGAEVLRQLGVEVASNEDALQSWGAWIKTNAPLIGAAVRDIVRTIGEVIAWVLARAREMLMTMEQVRNAYRSFAEEMQRLLPGSDMSMSIEGRLAQMRQQQSQQQVFNTYVFPQNVVPMPAAQVRQDARNRLRLPGGFTR